MNHLTIIFESPFNAMFRFQVTKPFAVQGWGGIRGKMEITKEAVDIKDNIYSLVDIRRI